MTIIRVTRVGGWNATVWISGLRGQLNVEVFDERGSRRYTKGPGLTIFRSYCRPNWTVPGKSQRSAKPSRIRRMVASMQDSTVL